ncbi:hypothetical protein LCGC14_1076860, partial [marine sediment metagenome]
MCYDLEVAWSAIRDMLVKMSYRVGATEDDVQTVIMRFISVRGLYAAGEVSKSYWLTALRNVSRTDYQKRKRLNGGYFREIQISELEYPLQVSNPSTPESWIDLFDMKDDPDVHRMLAWDSDCAVGTPIRRVRESRLRAKLRKRYGVA